MRWAQRRPLPAAAAVAAAAAVGAAGAGGVAAGAAGAGWWCGRRGCATAASWARAPEARRRTARAAAAPTRPGPLPTPQQCVLNKDEPTIK